MRSPQSTILLVENNDDDVFFVRYSLRKAGIIDPLVVVRDGQEAIDYLENQANAMNQESTLPRMVLLDLNMPRMNGFDVLDWLAARPRFASLKVVILSASGSDKDIEKAKQKGAADYRVKPSALNNLIAMLKDLAGRWLSEQGQRSDTPATFPGNAYHFDNYRNSGNLFLGRFQSENRSR